MTERERWIVYPLLALALGSSLKSKLEQPSRGDLPAAGQQQIELDRIRCRQLLVVGSDGQPRVALFGDAHGGEVQVYDAKAAPVAVMHVDSLTRSGVVETRDGKGKPQTALMSTGDLSGQVVAYDKTRSWAMGLSFREIIPGFILTNYKTGHSIFEAFPMSGRRTPSPRGETEKEERPGRFQSQ